MVSPVVVCYAAFIWDCAILAFSVSVALTSVLKMCFVTCTFCEYSFLLLPVQGIVVSSILD